MNKRVFFAVNLPDEARERIRKTLLSELPDQGIKKIVEKNLHLTVLFLGNKNSEELNALAEKIRNKIKTKKFSLKLDGIGHFNHRVIWLGVTRGEQAVKELFDLAAECGEKKDEKFHPHLTLARNKFLGKNEIETTVKKLGGKNFTVEANIGSLDLMESVLTRLGPEYSVIERFALD